MPNLLVARGASLTIKDPKHVPGMNANMETFRFQIIDSLRKHVNYDEPIPKMTEYFLLVLVNHLH
jgi:hypothetical protein